MGRLLSTGANAYLSMKINKRYQKPFEIPLLAHPRVPLRDLIRLIHLLAHEVISVQCVAYHWHAIWSIGSSGPV